MARRGLLKPLERAEIRALASRVVAMLTKLIRS
jgi:hypothetical protein